MEGRPRGEGRRDGTGGRRPLIDVARIPTGPRHGAHLTVTDLDNALKLNL